MACAGFAVCGLVRAFSGAGAAVGAGAGARTEAACRRRRAVTGNPRRRNFRVFIQMKMWPPVPCALRSGPSEVEPLGVGAENIRRPPFLLLA